MGGRAGPGDFVRAVPHPPVMTPLQPERGAVRSISMEDHGRIHGIRERRHERHGRRLYLTPERLAAMRRFVHRSHLNVARPATLPGLFHPSHPRISILSFHFGKAQRKRLLNTTRIARPQWRSSNSRSRKNNGLHGIMPRISGHPADVSIFLVNPLQATVESRRHNSAETLSKDTDRTCCGLSHLGCP